jgi:plasmid stabilization system protein ParE
MVKWTLPARDDLKAIYEYIALDSKFYAKKIYNA